MTIRQPAESQNFKPTFPAGFIRVEELCANLKISRNGKIYQEMIRTLRELRTARIAQEPNCLDDNGAITVLLDENPVTFNMFSNVRNGNLSLGFSKDKVTQDSLERFVALQRQKCPRLMASAVAAIGTSLPRKNPWIGNYRDMQHRHIIGQAFNDGIIPVIFTHEDHERAFGESPPSR